MLHEWLYEKEGVVGNVYDFGRLRGGAQPVLEG